MPSILFQPTSISFGEAKSFVAEQFSKQSTTGMLLRAGRAIQRAVGDWNKYNWEWNVVTATDIPVTAGVTEYDLPYDFRDLYAVLLTLGGTAKALAGDSVRNYLRANPDQTSGDTTSYSLLRRGSTGKIRLMTPPDSGGTLSEFHYYRRIISPCSVSATATWSEDAVTASIVGGSLQGSYLGNLLQPVTPSTAIADDTYVTNINLPGNIITVNTAFPAAGASVPVTIGGDDVLLDMPEDHVWALLARACEHFLIGVNAPEKLVSYWAQAARAGLKESRGSTNNMADRMVAFVPATYTGWPNPNRIIE